MGRQTFGIFVILALVLFCVGVLFVGQEYSSSSELVSVRIGGITDAQSEKHMQDLMKMVTGIETLIFNKNAGMCTFRYDSSKINYKAIEAQFSALGLTITPITPIDKFSIDPKSSDQKLIRIRFLKASE